MDPITLAIVAAVTAGVTKVGEQVIVDAYAALKAVLQRKFGAQSEVAKAVEGVEARPDSQSRKGTLQEEVAASRADQDPEVLAAAQALLEKIKAQPNGARIVQRATGNYIAQAGDHSTATVNVNQPKP